MARELPTADEIARALWLAAKEVGDEDRLALAVEDPRPLITLRALVTRARWLAIEALHVLYPGARLHQLGEWCFYAGAAKNVMVCLLSAQRAAWWSQASVDRVISGI
jgi:hypothetical protein